MLIPKKVKHRKWQKGRGKKRLTETRGVSLAFGSAGLLAIEAARINSRQIEAARKTISHFTKRRGKVWVRIFPDRPVTKRPPEVTMGGGKGVVDHYVFSVKPGRVLFEMDGVSSETAKEALRLAGHKLPIKTRVLTRK